MAIRTPWASLNADAARPLSGFFGAGLERGDGMKSIGARAPLLAVGNQVGFAKSIERFEDAMSPGRPQ